MKKLFLSIIFLSFYLYSFAATFSIDQKTITGSVECSGSSHFTNYITNNGATVISLGWHIIENTLPLAVCWTYIICDMQQCYPGIPQNGNDDMGSLPSGNSVELFDLEISTNGHSGNGKLKLYVYHLGNPSDGDTVVFDISGCDSGSVCPLSLKENMVGSFIHIYPNPVRDEIYIESTNNFQFTHVSLYDIYGRKIEGLMGVVSSGNISISVADLPPGIYFVRIKGNDKSFYFKKVLKVP
jgi:hypothetical protein